MHDATFCLFARGTERKRPIRLLSLSPFFHPVFLLTKKKSSKLFASCNRFERWNSIRWIISRKIIFHQRMSFGSSYGHHHIANISEGENRFENWNSPRGLLAYISDYPWMTFTFYPLIKKGSNFREIRSRIFSYVCTLTREQGKVKRGGEGKQSRKFAWKFVEMKRSKRERERERKRERKSHVELSFSSGWWIFRGPRRLSLVGTKRRRGREGAGSPSSRNRRANT